MKKLLYSLCIAFFASSFLFAQTYPDPGSDIAVRAAFFSTTKTINGQSYTANWYSDTQNTMTKGANNIYSFQIFLPWSQDGSTAFTYYYTDVFKGQGATGPRQTGNRKFTLTQDRTVNFYAKAWYNTASAIYQTQMICDAQKVYFLFYGVTGFTAFTQELPLPVNGKSFAVVSLPTVASKIEYNVYDESTVSAPYAWSDLNNNVTNYKQQICAAGKGGRYKLAVDYTTITASTAKVLDGINTPQIKIGSGSFIDPANVSFSGNNLGTFNTGSPLNISGSLNAYSTNVAVNVSDVSAKLYYQITKSGYDSGVKELTLTNGGSTVQAGSVFANSSPLDITTGLDNGDYTLKVWYGVACLEDVLLIDNSGSKYTASFKVYNVQHSTGTTNWSTFSSTKKSVIVDNGELIIDQNAVADTITVNVGAKMTIGTGNSISGIVNLLSDATGTATLKDSYNIPTVSATVQQYVEAGRNWYISSPLLSVGYGVLNRGTSVVEWNELTKAWDNVTTGNLVAGKGYIQVATSAPAVTGSTGTVNFSGITNSGDVTVALTRTESGSSRGFNLIGNPYPSYLDWSLVIADAVNGNIGSTMWYRTKNTSGTYTFATHNGTSGETVTGTANTSITKFIPPMQAFWVRVNQNLDQTTYSTSITFKNTMREHRLDNANIFKAPKLEERKRLRLQVSNGTNADEAVIYFDTKAQDTFDAYDSPKMSNNSASIPEIYTTVENEKLVINGLNQLSTNEEIALGFSTGQSNSFTIKASELTNFDADTKIYLKDKLLNIEKDLEDSTPYTFKSDIISNNNRFSVVFKSLGETNDLVNNEEDSMILIYKNANNQITVNCQGNIDKNADVSVYNTLGQKLLTQQLIDATTIIDNSFPSGVYLVKASKGNKTSTQKVILN